MARSRYRKQGARRLPRGVPTVLAVLAMAGAIAFGERPALRALLPPEPTIFCRAPRVVDGDTFDCGGRRIRLSGIDAPEMPGHCRSGRDCTPGDPKAALERLRVLTRGEVSCAEVDTDVYGRTVARCAAEGRDLSCAMLASGNAVRRYAPILCL